MSHLVRPPEKDALQNMGHILNQALSTRSNPERLGAIVAAKGMLPEGGLDDIRGRNDSDYRKVMGIMSAVKSYITSPSHRNSRERITEKFNDFILILHNDLDLRDVAQDLAEECSKWVSIYDECLILPLSNL